MSTKNYVLSAEEEKLVTTLQGQLTSAGYAKGSIGNYVRVLRKLFGTHGYGKLRDKSVRDGVVGNKAVDKYAIRSFESVFGVETDFYPTARQLLRNFDREEAQAVLSYRLNHAYVPKDESKVESEPVALVEAEPELVAPQETAVRRTELDAKVVELREVMRQMGISSMTITVG